MADYNKVNKKLKQEMEKLDALKDLKLLANCYKLNKEVLKLESKIQKKEVLVNKIRKEISDIIASEV